MTSGQAKRDPSKLPSPGASEPEAAPAKPLTGEALPDWYRPPGTAAPAPDPPAAPPEPQTTPAPSERVAVPARHRAGRGPVIAVVSGKSGTGKSMIAANVACTIARDHRMTVAVVDLSLQFGDQALMFDAGSSPSMVDVLANIDALTPDFLLECMHQAHGLRILGAPPSPELADLVDASHVQAIVDQLRLLFDFIVLDTSSHLSEISLEAIDQADSLLIVTTPYLASVKDTKLLLKTMSDLGVPAAKLTAVLNRMEPAIKMGLEVLEANLKFPIGAELPHVPGLLVDSVTDGIPLALSRPNSEWGQRVSALGKMMVATTSAADGRKTKRGFLLGRSR
jgi:pilus assembly protein CpaE